MGSHDDKLAGMIRNLPAQTGRTLEEWLEIVRTDGPSSPKERHQWLKDVHGLGHFQAHLIASRAG